MGTKFVNQIRATNTAQTLFNISTLLGFVPEEVLTLGQLVTLTLGTLYGFQRIGVIARIPRFCGYRHGGWREVLHLFQLEVEMLGLDG